MSAATIFNRWNEEIPEGEVIMHKCDKPLCCNPEHLKKGTAKENTEDMIDKGRQVKGSKCGNAKLDEEMIYYIKFVSDKTDKELAEKFGVHVKTIQAIRKNKNWIHVIKNRYKIVA